MNRMSLYWFDIVTVIFLLACIVYSGLRGFVKEFFCVAAWIAGYFSAVAFHVYLAPVFTYFIKARIMVDLVSFFTTFAAAYISVRLFGFFARHRLGLKHIPKTIDHGTGAAMGLAKGVFFLAIFLSPLNLFPEMREKLENRSLAASSVMGVSEKIAKAFGSELARRPEQLKEKLKNVGGISSGTQKEILSKTDNYDENRRGDESAPTDKERKNMNEFIEELDRKNP